MTTSPFSKITILSALVACVLVTGCARRLVDTETIVVDGTEYIVRIYEYIGPNGEPAGDARNPLGITDAFVVVNGQEYNCGPGGVPDCPERVRSVLAGNVGPRGDESGGGSTDGGGGSSSGGGT